jgi:hypothetical protein
MCAVVAPGSDATASGPVIRLSHPALAIATTPTVQTLQARVVAKPGTGTPMLVLGTARFTITVTNTSPVELTDITVADRLSPRCNRAIGTLAPGASISYRCSQPNVGRSYTNTITASGQWPKDVRVLAGTQATASATTVVKAKPKTKRRVHAPPLALLPLTG